MAESAATVHAAPEACDEENVRVPCDGKKKIGSDSWNVNDIEGFLDLDGPAKGYLLPIPAVKWGQTSASDSGVHFRCL